MIPRILARVTQSVWPWLVGTALAAILASVYFRLQWWEAGLLTAIVIYVVDTVYTRAATPHRSSRDDLFPSRSPRSRLARARHGARRLVVSVGPLALFAFAFVWILTQPPTVLNAAIGLGAAIVGGAWVVWTTRTL